ncbi:MAG TPA: phosphoribosyltransferase family protein [Flavisolibacter sp.]|nr:phosphoribosyltransferase family protein [Flavisolibacter sp.]
METAQKRNGVLNKESIRRKMKRMALQIAEQNNEEKEIIIAGIAGNGSVVARQLVNDLQQIASFDIQLSEIHLNKKEPLEVSLSPEIDVKDKVVIVIDDVANTGKTMLYALKPFLASQPRKIQTLVLVERSHKLFPIQTDYAGLSIATTLQEHIAVETDGDDITGAWLY